MIEGNSMLNTSELKIGPKTILEAEDGPDKGQTVLWRLMKAAANGEQEALNKLAELSIGDIRPHLGDKVEDGPDKGQTVLWLLMVASTNGEQEASKKFAELSIDDIRPHFGDKETLKKLYEFVKVKSAELRDDETTDDDDEVFLCEQLSQCGVTEPRLEKTGKPGERIIFSDIFAPGQRSKFFHLASNARNKLGEEEQVKRVFNEDGKTVTAIKVQLMKM